MADTDRIVVTGGGGKNTDKSSVNPPDSAELIIRSRAKMVQENSAGRKEGT